VARVEEMSSSRIEEGTSDKRTVQDTVLEIVVVQMTQHAKVGIAANILQRFIPSDIGDLQIGYR
jgi:hypothetical protein